MCLEDFTVRVHMISTIEGMAAGDLDTGGAP